MYRLPAGIKRDPPRRWALTDRVFFGHGACHILAGVFLRRTGNHQWWALRVIPHEGFSGNHVLVTDGSLAFDYHGYARREALLGAHCRGWRSFSPGWQAEIERVDFDLLDTAELNARRMLGPDQYFRCPLDRARRFIDRFENRRAALAEDLGAK